MFAEKEVPPTPSQARRKKALEGGISMKKYMLTAIIDGNTTLTREFKSRSQAIDYIFNYYTRHNYISLYVEDEYYVNGDKHNIEYVCDYNNRFRIAREIA